MSPLEGCEHLVCCNKLNADKCKELVIDFNKVKHHFDAVTVNSQELERVDSVKLLGVSITNTLQWNCHILDVIQKVNKRIYFLILQMFQHTISFVSIFLYKTSSRILCPFVPSRTA